MIANVELPNGSVLSFSKGEKGVTKLFTNVTKSTLIVVYVDKVLNFANYPFTLEYERKQKEDEDIED